MILSYHLLLLLTYPTYWIFCWLTCTERYSSPASSRFGNINSFYSGSKNLFELFALFSILLALENCTVHFQPRLLDNADIVNVKGVFKIFQTCTYSLSNVKGFLCKFGGSNGMNKYTTLTIIWPINSIFKAFRTICSKYRLFFCCVLKLWLLKSWETGLDHHNSTWISEGPSKAWWPFCS